jgi:hypothetical protein
MSNSKSPPAEPGVYPILIINTGRMFHLFYYSNPRLFFYEDIKEDNMLESEDTYLILEQTQIKDGRSARCPWDSESKLCGRISGKWAGFDIHGIRITDYFFLLFVLHHRKVTIQSPLHKPRSYSGIDPFQRQGPWDGTWPQSWAGGPWPPFAPVRS